MVSQENKRYYGDLFAGCGGLSLGLEQAGFTPALVIEISPYAMETYLLNRDEKYPLLRERYNVSDIKTLVSDDALFTRIVKCMESDYGIDINNGELDLLVGGPPCQGYSGIGHRRSYSVEKSELPSNHLYTDMVTLIERFSPKIFLFENVKGILSGKWTADGKKGEIWNDVLSAFQGIAGYTVRWKLVHAKDYGVPQNRPRVLLIGIRAGIIPDNDLPDNAIESGFLPTPTFDYPSLCDLLSDLVDVKFQYGGRTTKYKKPPLNDCQRKLRTDENGAIMDKGHCLSEQEYGNHTSRVIEKFTYMLNNNGEIPDEFKTKKFAQKVLPPIWGKNGPTITACCLPDDYVHFSQPRILTVREWARLQMFPDWYEFAGKRTTGGIRRAGNPREGVYDRELPKYTQIGNAVPVQLAEKVGANLHRILEENNA
jgi:DNA (cytosine-5)-methyltransferase 1